MALSLAVITYNEEDNIVRLLDTFSDSADEIIIVDSFSTDKTKEVCARYPQVKFFEKQFNGYGEQKNHALSLCTQDWVLFLDADEVPNKEMKESILAIVTSPNTDFNVYNAKFINHLGIYIIKHGGWGNVVRERLFKRNAARYSDDKVHEFLITDEKSGILKGNIDHYTYKSIHHHVTKINRYSDMMAEKMFERGKKIKRYKVILSPFYEFNKVFFIRLGFLDGFAGFYVAKTMSYYTFLKYIKLREKIKLIELKKKHIKVT
ncbi:glycosyltransferase family 2 protein [Chryseobacterium ginsenosidimutans]|uniref:glycosyltransferase family 2 protein n=1 Tax=Chryseobacterium ginsenosidimutans TaxID=687846 RepID=UPI0031CDF046